MHASLFFYLPIQGNYKLHGTTWCDYRIIDNQDYACNELDLNPSLWWFYGLCCCYLFVSALQIRYGLPEDSTGYFMMNRYHWTGKFPFQIFYNVPFIFEMRSFIDWTFAKTSLDLF